MTKHGQTGSNTYLSWRAMKKRCGNQNNPSYKYYGGRGIKVCDRWLNSFKNFYEDMGKKPSGKSLDRINNDGNYEPRNCRWATYKEQGRNRKDNPCYKYKGGKKLLLEIAEETGINYFTLWSRLKRNWTPEKAFSTPVHRP